MKIIITESQFYQLNGHPTPPFLRKNLNKIDRYVKIALENSEPCDFESSKEFLNDTINHILLFTDNTDFKPYKKDVKLYIIKEHKQSIMEFYFSNKEDC